MREVKLIYLTKGSTANAQPKPSAGAGSWPVKRAVPSSNLERTSGLLDLEMVKWARPWGGDRSPTACAPSLLLLLSLPHYTSLTRGGQGQTHSAPAGLGENSKLISYVVFSKLTKLLLVQYIFCSNLEFYWRFQKLP